MLARSAALPARACCAVIVLLPFRPCPQKLHIRTVPLGEQPRRIAHQETTRTFAVTCTQANINMGGQCGKFGFLWFLFGVVRSPVPPLSAALLHACLGPPAFALGPCSSVHRRVAPPVAPPRLATAEGGDSVRLLDEQTFELLDRLQLQPHELACSVCRWAARLGRGPLGFAGQQRVFCGAPLCRQRAEPAAHPLP